MKATTKIKNKLNKYLKENLIIENNFFPKKSKLSYQNKQIYRKIVSIDNYIEQQLDKNSFQKTLFNYIDEQNKKDSDVYNKALIDRRLFSKIRNDTNYHPSKKTVICLGLALELNINKFEKLLNSAAYHLPKNNNFDLIIRFCIEEKIYNIVEVNNLLNEYNYNLLN